MRITSFCILFLVMVLSFRVSFAASASTSHQSDSRRISPCGELKFLDTNFDYVYIYPMRDSAGKTQLAAFGIYDLWSNQMSGNGLDAEPGGFMYWYPPGSYWNVVICYCDTESGVCEIELSHNPNILPGWISVWYDGFCVVPEPTTHMDPPNPLDLECNDSTPGSPGCK